MNNNFSIKAKQSVLLHMMKDVHRFCVENEIKYSLAYGSMLGAVRHNGFIPWDDDLDIIMDRENYEKFLSVCDKLSGYKIVPVLWINRIKKADDDSSSLETPTIDIFVLDNTPPRKALYFIKLALLCLLQGMLHKKAFSKNNSIAKKLLLFVPFLLGIFFTHNFKFRLYNKISQIGNRVPAEFVGIYNGEFSHIFKTFKKQSFSSVSAYTFEDTQLFISSDYDYLLTSLYGDYMTPPPESERVPKHDSH